MKKCPFCVEEIQNEAIICKNCNKYIGTEITYSDFKLGEFLEKSQYLIGPSWALVACLGFLHWTLIILGSMIMLMLANKLDNYRKAVNKATGG